jgi:hypothetical protein
MADGRLKMQEISSNPERLDAQLFDIFISRTAAECMVARIQQPEIIQDGRVVRFALERLHELPARRRIVATRHAILPPPLVVTIGQRCDHRGDEYRQTLVLRGALNQMYRQ